MLYFVKTPRWLQGLFPLYLWKMPASSNVLYLSFDDGPHPVHTAFVLDELKKFQAKATFFCLGKNVKLYPQLYERILSEGHAVGNHTMNHLNGKNTPDEVYLNDVAEAAKLIKSDLFRPPYGRIKSFQAKLLTAIERPYKIIMWTVLSGDFDAGISSKRCFENVLLKSRPGSVIVFHDSEKASEKMRFALPLILKNFKEKGFSFEKIRAGDIP